jgi:hypothetical protein
VIFFGTKKDEKKINKHQQATYIEIEEAKQSLNNSRKYHI